MDKAKVDLTRNEAKLRTDRLGVELEVAKVEKLKAEAKQPKSTVTKAVVLEATKKLKAKNKGKEGKDKEKTGRDHHHTAFSTLLAGGGVRPGTVYGTSDEFGMDAQENPVHVHDLHATILHLLGLDHERLTYRYSGRDFRLTDVHGQIVKGILA